MASRRPQPAIEVLCLDCGQALSDPESRQRMRGPVCQERTFPGQGRPASRRPAARRAVNVDLLSLLADLDADDVEPAAA